MNNIDEILEKIDEQTLKSLIRKIHHTSEFKILNQKTQIKNSAVESNNKYDEKMTNRQTHSFQVSNVAYEIVKSSGSSEKEALVAQLVGICHDLGHTPFGHDGENFFSEKTGKQFNHAKYGAKVFEKVFKEVLNSKHPKTGKDTFDKETKESLEELGTFVEAGIFSEEIIENLEGLQDYIKSGVNFHQYGYYSFTIDEDLKTLTGKELEFLKMAFENPCIQAGMLADTVAFMQSDVRDILNARNPFDESQTIITIEDELEIAEGLHFNEKDIQKLKNQLLLMGQEVDLEGLENKDALRKILETLGEININQIQKVMANQIGEQGLNEKGRFESISDEYKLLADKNEKGYRAYLKANNLSEEIIDKDGWEQFREKELRKQQDLMKAKNPLLCLTYEIQNELMYNEIIYGDKIKLLNNDVERNRAIFSRSYDYLERITATNSSELTTDELEVKKQMMQIYKSGNYPRQFKERKEDDSINKKAIITNLVIFKMQQMGNKELKDFYQEKIASKEKSIEIEIETLEKQGKSEDEIMTILQGIDAESYEDYKQTDEQKRQDIEKLQDKTEQEISSELGIEKRDIDEIRDGKTSLNRNLEYNMTYNEIEQISENMQVTEPDSKSDMASYEWSNSMSEGEETNFNMEKYVRNAIAFANVTMEDVVEVENHERALLERENQREGESQR